MQRWIVGVVIALLSSLAYAGAGATASIRGLGSDFDRSVEKTTCCLAGDSSFTSLTGEFGRGVSATFLYTLSVFDDGLASPFQGYCPYTPTYANCQPNTSGFERAIALVHVTFLETGDSNFYGATSYECKRLSTVADDQPQSFTVTGTCSIGFTSIYEFAPITAHYRIELFLMVDAAPIPEPSTYAMLLTALVLLGFRVHGVKRSHRVRAE